MEYEACKETDYFDKLYEKILEARSCIDNNDTFRTYSILLELGNLVRINVSEKYKEK